MGGRAAGCWPPRPAAAPGGRCRLRSHGGARQASACWGRRRCLWMPLEKIRLARRFATGRTPRASSQRSAGTLGAASHACVAVPCRRLPCKARALPSQAEHRVGGAISFQRRPLSACHACLPRRLPAGCRFHSNACRPRLLGVVDSGDVKISGVTLTGAHRNHRPKRRLLHCAALQDASQDHSAPCRPHLLGLPRVSERASGHQRCHHPRRPRHPQQRWWVADSSWLLLRLQLSLPLTLSSCRGAAAAPPLAAPLSAARPAHCCTHRPALARHAFAHAGIDVDGSRYVTIRGVDIDTADDAICVKTTGKWPTAHVIVTGSK